jgi:nicotinamidase-related amidase
MKCAFGLSVPEDLKDLCDPSRSALIIYDMQNGIVPQIGEGPAIASRCLELLNAARSNGFRIFFTRHLFLPNSVVGSGQLRRAMIWQHLDDPAKTKPYMTQGSFSWQIVSQLAPMEGEVVIDKITMSAFEGTFLNLALRDAHLQSIIIAGIAIDVGIEPTVRHALDLNYVPVLVQDACGSKTSEAKQRSMATLAATGEVLTPTTTEVVALMTG